MGSNCYVVRLLRCTRPHKRWEREMRQDEENKKELCVCVSRFNRRRRRHWLLYSTIERTNEWNEMEWTLCNNKVAVALADVVVWLIFTL